MGRDYAQSEAEVLVGRAGTDLNFSKVIPFEIIYEPNCPRFQLQRSRAY